MKKKRFILSTILSSKGFVGEVSKKNKGSIARYISVVLLYEKDGSPRVTNVDRISKPSRRLYTKAKDIRKFRRGLYIALRVIRNLRARFGVR